ncbi:unnamed protein product [Clavelina lepadiformis]|uniref:Uncharacterized protein n=1 Tax=Clavelina lepadiformis TaxID=159417 RepID=A0ABP0G434_CLALP
MIILVNQKYAHKPSTNGEKRKDPERLKRTRFIEQVGIVYSAKNLNLAASTFPKILQMVGGVVFDLM